MCTGRRLSAFSIRLALVLVFVSCLGAFGTGPRYSFQHYGTESGLGNSTVLSLLQDKAGYLWVGTEAGLYRYEGSRFRLMGATDGLACLAEVRGLAEAKDGSLWAIACNHLYRSSGGRFELAAPRDIVVNSLKGITSDGDDGVIVATLDGLLQASGHRDGHGHLSVRMFTLPDRLRGKPMHGVSWDGRTLWFGCEEGLCSLQSGKLTQYGSKDGLPSADWDAIQMTPTGDLWLRSAKLTYWRPHGQADFRRLPALAPSFYSGFLGISSDGSILAPTNDGLALFNSHGVQTIGEAQGLHTSLTSVAIQDREGSIWVGLIGEGLARWLGRDEWEGWTKENGLPSNLIWNIIRAQSDRALWIGTGQGIVRFPVKGAARTWSWAQQVNGTVRWLREAPDGAIWLIAQGDTLARIEPHSGQMNFFGKAQGMTAKELLRGCFDRKGRLWISTRAGLFVATKPTLSAHFEFVPGSPKGIWDVAEDKQGALFATTAHGLWRYRDTRWRRYDKRDGLLSDSPYVIAIAPDGALWLRHRYDGIVERVVFDGEQVARVSEIKPDGVPAELTALHGFDSFGHYWQGTSNGLSMLANPVAHLAESDGKQGGLSGKEANAWRSFSVEDGLISNDCDGEAFWADDDGSVWIGTSSGLAHYSSHENYSHGTSGEEAPVITSVQISQRPRFARIEFSSLSFKTEGQAQFGYSIDGGNWVNAKERAVTLAALRPGQHRLRVRMHGWGHSWSKRTAETEFRFEPFWWETWWAISGLYLTAAATVFAILRLWMDAQRRRAAEWAYILGEKARAEASSQAKSLFLANMSHEIRTPLHQIIGLTEDLTACDLPVDAWELTNQLRSSGMGLLGLLNGILDFSKIEAGKLEIEKAPFNLYTCLDESVALFAQAVKEKQIGMALVRDPVLPCYVMGDSTRLRQVLTYLISNAVKFTHDGTVRVEATVTLSRDRQSLVTFSVIDSGIGIAEEKLEALFRPFTQGDTSTARQYGGAGLGLTIARSLVLLMGGEDFVVQSRLGEGTSFVFSIPFEHAAVEKKKPAPVAIGSSTLHILVVEDNKINQKIMLNLLARLGYKADLATDGAEAIEAVTRQMYDVILMDVQMPNVDGLEATREIRKYFAGRRQPQIFAVTAHDTKDDHDKCTDAGMDGYMTKPVSKELLSLTLAEVEGTLTGTATPPMSSEQTQTPGG